jgi:hypothetical protein
MTNLTTSPGRLAAEAIIELLGGGNGERGRFFGVERAQAGIIVGAGLAQPHPLADDGDNVDAGFELLDKVHGGIGLLSRIGGPILTNRHLDWRNPADDTL